MSGATMEARDRPFPFSYYVFWSKGGEPTAEERESGIYLVEVAEARYLQRFFDPLYEAAGIGICTSDDEIIPSSKLTALLDAVIGALREVEQQPEQWPVTVGYTFEANQMEPDAEIVRSASRARLIEFLQGTEKIVRQAIDSEGYVHFGGGG